MQHKHHKSKSWLSIRNNDHKVSQMFYLVLPIGKITQTIFL